MKANIKVDQALQPHTDKCGILRLLYTCENLKCFYIFVHMFDPLKTNKKTSPSIQVLIETDPWIHEKKNELNVIGILAVTSKGEI